MSEPIPSHGPIDAYFEHGIHQRDLDDMAKALRPATAPAAYDGSALGLEALRHAAASGRKHAMLIFFPGAGSRLDAAALEVATRARALGYGMAALSFNGVYSRVEATGADTPQEMAQGLRAEHERRSAAQYEAHTRTPAYKLEQANHEAREREACAASTASHAGALRLIGELGSAAASDSQFYARLGKWITSDRATAEQLSSMSAALSQAGFVANEGVGEQGVKDKSDRLAFGRYCVGQALAMAQTMSAIHPMLGEWMQEHAQALALARPD